MKLRVIWKVKGKGWEFELEKLLDSVDLGDEGMLENAMLYEGDESILYYADMPAWYLVGDLVLDDINYSFVPKYPQDVRQEGDYHLYPVVYEFDRDGSIILVKEGREVEDFVVMCGVRNTERGL